MLQLFGCLVDRFEQFYLLFHFVDVVLGFHQILEVVAQFNVLGLRRLLVQHVVADKVVEVVQYLYTHNLIEQGQRILGTHVE